MRRGPGGGKSAILPEGRSESGPLATPDRGHPQWTGWLSPGIGSTLGRIRLLAAVRSPCLQIEAGEHGRFDRIFGLDGHIMGAAPVPAAERRHAWQLDRALRCYHAALHPVAVRPAPAPAGAFRQRRRRRVRCSFAPWDPPPWQVPRGFP